MSEVIESALREFKSRLSRRKLSVALRDAYLRAIEDAAGLNQQLFREQGDFLGHFTSHGPDHSARVMLHALTLADQLKNGNGGLSPRELLILGLAAFLHDLGMTEPLPESENAYCATDEERWAARRKRHPDAVASVLRREGEASLAFLKNLDPILFDKFLICVCRAHSAKHFPGCANYFRLHHDSDPDTRYIMLAGLLLLSDEMDLVRERARIGYPHYDQFSTSTKAHWWKHWLVENCYLEGTIFKIVHVPDAVLPGSKVFQDWTIKKLEEQLAMLRREVDPTTTSIFSKLMIHPVETGSLPGHAPELPNEAVEWARRQLDKAPEQQNKPIEEPTALIHELEYPDQAVSSSEAFDKIIWPNISVFRGQAFYSAEDTITETYVWVDDNTRLINTLSGTLAELLMRRRELPERPIAGDPHVDRHSGVIRQTRNLWPVVGKIGVGKSHFLQMMLWKFKRDHPDLYQRTLIVICEAMRSDKERQTLLDVKREVAKSLYAELERVVTIQILSDTIHAHGLRSAIPRYRSDIEVFSLREIDEFIDFTTTLINGLDGRRLLGERHPIAMCVFLDNSDRLPEELVFDLHLWCYDLAGEKAAAVMTFYRPDTYDKILMSHQSLYDHMSWRTPHVVQPPDPHEMLAKRINYLYNNAQLPGRRDVIEISDLNGRVGSKITIKDIKAALQHLNQHLLESDRGMLLSLACTNMRMLLQAYVRILSSWVIDSRTFFINLLSADSDVSDQGVARTGWPRMLEALILGHRKWYDPKYSPVENLFSPPAIEHFGDYFVAIHILQLIDQGVKKSTDKRFTVTALRQAAGELGYSEPRVDQVLKWLVTKAPIAIGDKDYYQMVPLIDGLLPDQRQFIPTLEPYNPRLQLALTPWGSYHLSTLIYQLRYWKHVMYTTVLPAATARQMGGDLYQMIGRSHLFASLDILQQYLLECETTWFGIQRNVGDSVWPVVRRAIEDVKHQKGAD